jgi:hypothetical protein
LKVRIHHHCTTNTLSLRHSCIGFSLLIHYQYASTTITATTLSQWFCSTTYNNTTMTLHYQNDTALVRHCHYNNTAIVLHYYYTNKNTTLALHYFYSTNTVILLHHQCNYILHCRCITTKSHTTALPSRTLYGMLYNVVSIIIIYTSPVYMY